MSKKEREYIHFIEDIADAIVKIEKYTRNIDYEIFTGNEMIIDAVLRNFEVIGEAIKNIPHEIREKYPNVEWSEAVGFRNVLIHNYFGLDTEALWDTIKENIPGLKKHIEQALMSERAILG